MHRDTLERIRSLLQRFGITASEALPETTIQSLRMVPEELEDFLNQFQNEFEINWLNFNYYDYFLEEVEPGAVLRNIFYRIFRPEKLIRTPLTIEHLIKVAEKGEWFKPNN